MAATYITTQVFTKNNQCFGQFTTLPIESLPCIGTEVGDLYWFVPQVVNGIFKGYGFPILSSVKPTPDSVKCLRLTVPSSNTVYHIPIADGSNESVWVAACNGCCGATVTLPAYTIPTPIVEFPGAFTSPNYTYNWLYPSDPSNYENITASGSWNGVAAPALTAGGYTGYAAVLTAIQAAWSGAGTWSNVTTGGNTFLHLTSTTSLTAGVKLALVPLVYCLPLPSSDFPVDTIVIGGTTITLPAQVLMTRSNPQALLFALAPYLGQANLSVAVSSGNAALSYTGNMVPQTIKLGSTTRATWAVGVCTP